VPRRESGVFAVTTKRAASSRSGRARPALLLTCEHAGNRIPREYLPLFRNAAAVLETHRGLDIGALTVARHLARVTEAPLLFTEVSRLLVDNNRSLGNRTLFSEFVGALSNSDQQKILDAYYVPHRHAVEEAVRAARGRAASVLHLGIHSFTPVMNGVKRRADIGLLYDPTRPKERRFCDALHAALERIEPSFLIRRNYPYKGTGDGLTTALRKIHPAARYAGVEIEFNQGLLATRQDALRVAKSFGEALGSLI
jgi:predicted N-formylglutamate amidohydrolase